MNTQAVKEAFTKAIGELLSNQHIQALEEEAKDQILNHLAGTVSAFELRAVQKAKDLQMANTLSFDPKVRTEPPPLVSSQPPPKAAATVAEPEPKPIAPPTEPPAPPAPPSAPPAAEPAGKV